EGMELEGAAFACGGKIGRQWRLEAPGRDALDLLERWWASERSAQHAGIARRGGGRIETADHGFERSDFAPRGATMSDERRRHERLADIGAGTGDEDRGHVGACSRVWAPSGRSRHTTRARRSISASGWPAVKVNRSRAVPTGTVGGRIATTRKPSFSSCRAAA